MAQIGNGYMLRFGEKVVLESDSIFYRLVENRLTGFATAGLSEGQFIKFFVSKLISAVLCTYRRFPNIRSIPFPGLCVSALFT